jgi:protein gp37
MKDSKIQWTDNTFNPWRGCTKISEGCTNCYAETGSKRNPKVLARWGPKGTRVLAADAQWREVKRWEEESSRTGQRQRVFCASLADVFEDWQGQMVDSQERLLWLDHCGNITPQKPPAYSGFPAPDPCTLDGARERLWKLIRNTPHLDWLLLTKRPDNIGQMMPQGDWPNVWLGTSVENQNWLCRVDALLDAPQQVPVHFVSAEPLLGPLVFPPHVLGPTAINWIIPGGESGGGARKCSLEWVRDLIAQSQAAGVACFVKQLGKVRVDSGSNPDGNRWESTSDRFSLNVIKHQKGGEIAEWPAELQVRQFPA